MTPNDIEILIHCYVSGARHPRYEHNEGVFKGFIADGLIIFADKDIYYATEKGAAHIQQLCSLPLPVKQFVGYDGKIIKP